jgi:hypothetical protein
MRLNSPVLYSTRAEIESHDTQPLKLAESESSQRAGWILVDYIVAWLPRDWCSEVLISIILAF